MFSFELFLSLKIRLCRATSSRLSSFGGSLFPSLKDLEDANYHDYRLRRLPKHIKHLASSEPFLKDTRNDLESLIVMLFEETMTVESTIYFRAKNRAQSTPCLSAILGFTGMAYSCSSSGCCGRFARLNKDPNWRSEQSRFHPDSLIWLSRNGFG